MSGCDISKWNGPTPPPNYDFYIIQTSHGVSEEPGWRDQFNYVVNVLKKPLGLYHFGEGLDSIAATDNAHTFRDLTNFLNPNQLQYGWWGDFETGMGDNYLDVFRGEVVLPFCGVYGSLNDFNNHYPTYKHFSMNWLAYGGDGVPAGWSIPDHILLQTGANNGVDVDVKLPAQPYPLAWN